MRIFVPKYVKMALMKRIYSLFPILFLIATMLFRPYSVQAQNCCPEKSPLGVLGHYEYDKDWNKENYHDYIKSDKWREKRLECLKRDNYQCQKCGTAISLVIHHTTYDKLGNEDLGDLVTLCKDCHKKVHENDLKK